MDKEIREKLNKLLDNMLDKVANKIEKMDGACKEAISKPCKIHIDKDTKGTKLDVEGNKLTLLLTLAGAEKNILKELNCSNEEFEIIKNMVGTEEVNE